MTADSREITYRVLLEYKKTGSFIGDILEVALRKNQFEEKKLRAFVSRLSEGVVERKITLDFIIRKFSRTPLEKIKPEILTLLRMGIYQILYMESVPESAAVNETVKLAKSHSFSSLTGYINAVLRAVIKADNENRLRGMIGSSNEVRYSTPAWICRLITDSYGKDEGKRILEAQFTDRPTAIRVNTSKVSKEELAAALSESGVEVKSGALAENSLRISGYDFIRKLPGYREGWFSVQDESSSYAVERLYKHFGKAEEGKIKVLDLCSAPGGKSLYMAELLGEKGQIISRDISVDKTDMIRENAGRLGLQNIIIQERDASVFDKEMEDGADIVIADVPCSGLGVMGHKNDIKYNITEESIRELRELGLKIIRNAIRYIKPGGLMMFSTCTINPAENGDMLRKLFSLEAGSKTDGELTPVTSEVSENMKTARFRVLEEKQLLQSSHICDGFYYAIIERCDLT